MLLGLFWLVGVCHLDGIIIAVVGWVFQEKSSEVPTETTSKGSLLLVGALRVRTTVCVQWKSHHPPPQKKAATQQVQYSAFVSINPATSQSVTTLGHLSFFLFYIPYFNLFFTSFFCFSIYFVSIRNGSLQKRRLLSMNSWTMPKLWPNWPKPSLSSRSIACAWSVAAPKQVTTQVTSYVGNGRCKRQRRGEDLLGQQRGGKVRNWQRWTLAFFNSWFIDEW